jgi:hypothetical protein
VTTLSARTPEQTEIALFWVEASGTVIWNRIARIVSASRSPNIWENARLFALLNMAIGDAYIACWDTKFHYNYWRPITAIREADSDGNPDTIADPTWTPLVETPPIPELRLRARRGGFGSRNDPASVDWHGQRRLFHVQHVPAGRQHLQRSVSGEALLYELLTGRAGERAFAVYVGFHFRKAVEEGIEHGGKVAD